MLASAFKYRRDDDFGSLIPLAQWNLLESAFLDLRVARAGRLVPMGFILALGAVTGQAWCLAWLLTAMAGLAIGPSLASQFEQRTADTSLQVWLRKYRLAVLCQSAGVGVGGFAAGWDGNLTTTLLAGFPIGFAVLEVCTTAILIRTAHARLMILGVPVIASCWLHAALMPGGLPHAAVGGFFALWILGSLPLTHAAAERVRMLAAALAAHAGGDRFTILQPALAPAAADFQKLVGRDPVTGLPNRHSFGHILAQEGDRASRAEAPLSVLLVAWDDYDNCVARLTPHAVNERSSEIAKRLRAWLRRQSDLLASLGDGKFGILLPATDAFGAAVVARNLQAGLLRQLADSADGIEAPPVPASIGIATYCGKGVLPRGELLEHAEEALRAAREAGGNTIKRYDAAGKALRPKPYKGPKPKETSPYSTPESKNTPSPIVPVQQHVAPTLENAAITKDALGLELHS